MKFTIDKARKRIHLMNGSRHRALGSPLGNGFEMVGPVDMAMAILLEVYQSSAYMRKYCYRFSRHLEVLTRDKTRPVEITGDEVRLWGAANEACVTTDERIERLIDPILTHVKLKSFRINGRRFYSAWVLDNYSGFPFKNLSVTRAMLAREIVEMVEHELDGGSRRELTWRYGVSSNTLRQLFKALDIARRKRGGLQPSGRTTSQRRVIQ